MSLIYVLYVTVAQAVATLMRGGGFSQGFLSSAGMKVEAETGKCACARQELPLHRESGAQTAVSHVEWWGEGEEKVLTRK